MLSTLGFELWILPNMLTGKNKFHVIVSFLTCLVILLNMTLFNLSSSTFNTLINVTMKSFINQYRTLASRWSFRWCGVVTGNQGTDFVWKKTSYYWTQMKTINYLHICTWKQKWPCTLTYLSKLDNICRVQNSNDK